jgi:hypothetical protein
MTTDERLRRLQADMNVIDAILGFFAAVERALCAAEMGMNGAAMDPRDVRPEGPPTEPLEPV